MRILSKPALGSKASWTCQLMMKPAAAVRLSKVMVPGELPGERTDPEVVTTSPAVPAPPSTAPELSATLPTAPLTESVPDDTATLSDGAEAETLSVPAPCFWSEAPEPMTGAVANVTLLLPRSSLAVALAATRRLAERSLELLPTQRSVVLLPTLRTASAGRAADSRPRVAPGAASIRTSFLKRLAGPPITHVPAPLMARSARATLPSARLAAKRLVVPGLVAVSVSAGASPVVAMTAAEVNSRLPAPVAEMPAEPPMVKLRVVTAAVPPLNSSVEPAPRTSFVGSERLVMPSGLAVVPSPKSAMAMVPPPVTEVAPVKVLSPVSSSRPASVFVSVTPTPSSTTSSVPVVVGSAEAAKVPPVRVAPSASTITLLMV